MSYLGVTLGNFAGNWWGNVYAPAPPSPPATSQGGGGSRGKRKARIVRYSDFETREAFEQALRAVIPATLPPAPIPIEDDDDDIIASLLMMMH